MKERPILFSGEMVRAVLSGRKTQTRRIVTAINHELFEAFEPAGPAGFWGFDVANNPVVCLNSPYGESGDRLWVRETFVPACNFDPSPENGVFYRADQHEKYNRMNIEWRWKPSIHMPRWASRITLEVKAVRIERLNDISNDDCVAEGITAIGKAVRLSTGQYAQAGRYENSASTVRQLFSQLWDEINGSGSWALNPWVWVVDFQRI